MSFALNESGVSGNDRAGLADVEHIKQLKARYCRYIDTKQWQRLHEVFTDDARFEGMGSAPFGADVTTFVNGISARLKDVISIHHCHNPEIVFTTPTTARGIWAMMDYLEWPEGTSPWEAPNHRGFSGYGYYEEEYRKVGVQWKICLVRLTRIRVDALSDDNPSPGKGLLAPSIDWIDTLS